MSPPDGDFWKLARAKTVKQRLLAAQAIAAPEDVVTFLVNDSSPAVRRALAARADLQEHRVLYQLAHDSDLKTRQALVANPNCPPEILIELVDDPHRSVRLDLPSHPNISEPVRKVIARSPDGDLRRLMAEDANLDPETTNLLLSDPAETVRAALAGHTSYPAILESLLKEDSDVVRAGAAQNSLTTIEQRRALARDPAALVRANLLKYVELEEDELLLLAQDRSINEPFSSSRDLLVLLYTD
ncbi:hypothetical protein [Nonomuraea sp. NPDC050540]|uniref:hypothetical protein n=1 Tax=Nonomuraea sp. NPDC050540 TaxID=3364367 RepID=UPI00379F5789